MTLDFLISSFVNKSLGHTRGFESSESENAGESSPLAADGDFRWDGRTAQMAAAGAALPFDVRSVGLCLR